MNTLKGNIIMKRVILIALLFDIFCLESAICKPQLPYHSHKEFIDFVQNIKKKITTEHSYQIETVEELVLGQGQAARLDFKDNPAGVAEFILFYKDELVHIIYRCTDETDQEYNSTSLHSERLKDFRGINATGATTYLEIYTECEFKNGKAFVKFRTELPSKEELEKIKSRTKKIRKQRETTIDEVVSRLRETLSKEIRYEFGTVKEVTIVPDNKTVLLKCSDNPEAVEEIIIGANSKHLYIYCVLSSGSITGGGSRLGHSVGSFRQVGGSAAIGMWENKNGDIHLKFQLTDDDSTMIQSYRELEKQENFSVMIKNWDTLFEDLELMFPRLTLAQRVEAFTRLWSTVKYNFANFDLVPELNWNSILTEYLPKVMTDQSNNEYALLLTECVAQLRDGHTSVRSKWGNGLSTARPPLRIRSVGGKAIVTEIAKTEEIKASAIKPGDEITHVDERPVREILEKKIYPYIFASTPQGRDLKAYPRILQGAKESTVSLTIQTSGGEERKVSLTRKANSKSLLPRRIRPPNFEYRDMGDGLAYVALNTFGTDKVVDEFNEKFNEIRNAKGLVIDVRENGGGSSRHGHAIIARLIDKAIPATRWKTPQYRAAFRAWGRDEEWYDGGHKMINPETDTPFPGPVVVLIGPETNSAAEDFVVPLHSAGRATVVGQKSRGSTGQPLQFSFLDGKISGRVCTKRDQYPDGREFVGVGIIPDIEVHPTIEDVINDRDVVLEKGIAVLKDHIAKQK